MNYYYKLNLPDNPLVDDAIERLTTQKMNSDHPVSYNNIYNNPEDYFIDEVFDILDRLQLSPLYFVHFGSKNNSVIRTILHSDIARLNDSWAPDCAAINWDILPGTTEFIWYDTGTIEKIYPSLNSTNQIHNGIHYGQRNSKDVDNCTPLCKLYMARKTPYLLRTDVPHQIRYLSEMPVRIGISLRFPITSFSSWEHAVERFDQLLS